MNNRTGSTLGSGAKSGVATPSEVRKIGMDWRGVAVVSCRHNTSRPDASFALNARASIEY
jgi:hypothetical protein